MQELWTVIKLSLWAIFLACLLAYIVGLVQKHYIDADRRDFDSYFEGEFL